MSNKEISKFESKTRLKELTPYETLKKIGLEEDQVFCDIGAGTGIFTFAASGITDNDIYAVEVSEEMINLLEERKKVGKVQQLVILKGNQNTLPIVTDSVDLVLLSTVLHELDNPSKILDEIRRIKKEEAKLAIIEFHKRETMMGPPVTHRISKSEVESLCKNSHFVLVKTIDLGDNFYLAIYK